MLSGEAANTNLIVFDLTRLGLEPTIYRTRGVLFLKCNIKYLNLFVECK